MNIYVTFGDDNIQTGAMRQPEKPSADWHEAPAGYDMSSSVLCVLDNGVARLMTLDEQAAHTQKLADAAALEALTVSVRRFTKQLLGIMVYGSLITALDSLKTKYAAGDASEQEVRYLTVLNAADRMMMHGDLQLLDPAVSMVLDIAVALESVPFDADDKVRVLDNVPLE